MAALADAYTADESQLLLTASTNCRNIDFRFDRELQSNRLGGMMGVMAILLGIVIMLLCYKQNDRGKVLLIAGAFLLVYRYGLPAIAVSYAVGRTVWHAVESVLLYILPGAMILFGALGAWDCLGRWRVHQGFKARFGTILILLSVIGGAYGYVEFCSAANDKGSGGAFFFALVLFFGGTACLPKLDTLKLALAENSSGPGDSADAGSQWPYNTRS